MSDSELATTVDTPTVGWAPWLTPGIVVTGAAVLGTIWHGGLAKLLGSRHTGRPVLKPLSQ